jgi:antitoxin CcdA
MTDTAAKDLLKRAVNLTVRADLLASARQFGVNLSATLEAALEAVVRDRQREQWKIQHHAAIQAYNAHVDEHGVFSDGLRSF